MKPTFSTLALLFFASIGMRLPAQHPAAHWDFEGRDASVAAESAKRGHDLALQGVQRVHGAIGKGIYFLGAQSSARGALPEALQSPQAVTVEAWVRPDSVSAGVEGAGIVNAGNYLMRITRGTPSFHVFTSRWRPVLAESKAQEGRWLHLVGTYDGARMCIYVNGALAGTVERQGAIPRSASPLVLGRQASPFIGVIDEVRVTLRCLTASDVKARFDACCRQLNPGIEPGVSKHEYEGPYREPAFLPEPPPALQPFARKRAVGRAPEQVGESLLTVQTALCCSETTTEEEARAHLSQRWPAAGKLGCGRLLLWPLPGSRNEWQAFDQAMGTPQPSGVIVTVPVPAHLAAMRAVWRRLAPNAERLTTLALENGMPEDPAAPLASWGRLWDDREWLAAATELRRHAPPSTRIALARLPLLGDGALEQLASVAATAEGVAAAISVYVTVADASEAQIEAALRSAQGVCRRHALRLLLDAACPTTRVPEPERSTRFLRLLAVCHQLRVPVTWWNGDGFGTLDRHGQHTRLSYTVQAWQSLVDAPAEEPSGEVTSTGTRIVRWRDGHARPYVAWWRPTAGQDEIGSAQIQLPAAAVALDPLHARELVLPESGPVPVCRWPLVARGSAW